ncbi:hypothetical protein BHM03_00009061 [Ensete ventricosum]|nr:hypothetical protein BHM03_00009061 [Ensete ventricosum]
MDPGSYLGIMPKFGRCGGSSPGVRLDFAECIEKITMNMSGDRLRKTVRLTTGNIEGCRIVGVRSLIKLGDHSELKVEGGKAVVEYKASQGFQSRLEKMGQMTYEFSYRVALERFRAKYLESSIEDDPFAKRPEDTNMRMKYAGPLMIVLLHSVQQILTYITPISLALNSVLVLESCRHGTSRLHSDTRQFSAVKLIAHEEPQCTKVQALLVSKCYWKYCVVADESARHGSAWVYRIDSAGFRGSGELDETTRLCDVQAPRFVGVGHVGLKGAYVTCKNAYL